MPNIKKANKIGFLQNFGSNAFSVGLVSEHSGRGVSSSSADFEGSFFFLISKNSLKSAKGRNPSTQEVYKGAPKKRTEALGH
jgi:hypothetical protein